MADGGRRDGRAAPFLQGPARGTSRRGFGHPALVTGWLSETQTRKNAAQTQLQQATSSNSPEQGLSRDEVATLVRGR